MPSTVDNIIPASEIDTTNRLLKCTVIFGSSIGASITGFVQLVKYIVKVSDEIMSIYPYNINQPTEQTTTKAKIEFTFDLYFRAVITKTV